MKNLLKTLDYPLPTPHTPPEQHPMPTRVKPIARIRQKYVDRAGVAGGDYVEGVRAPRRPQAETAIAAADNYRNSLTASFGRNAYEKGLQRSGEAKWTRKSISVGAPRYPQGVTEGAQDYQTAIAPYIAAIEALDLSPRFPTGDDRNYIRVREVGQELRRVKLGGS